MHPSELRRQKKTRGCAGSGCVGVVVVGRARGLGRLQRGWLIVQDGSRDRGGWFEGWLPCED